MGSTVARIAVWFGVILAAAWVSLYLAWQALSAANFAFPMIYDMAQVGENVSEFGAKNRYKKGFETTTRAEHYRLFGEIVTAINNGGAGLDQIRYRGPDGREIDVMLREPEVVHLQDVARLLDRLRVVSYGALLTLGVLVAICYGRRWRFPGLPRILLGALAVSASAVVFTFFYGPERLFYGWHTWVFPEGHQWFFYYQDSLMTTLMRAPVIFGYMAGLLAVAALAIFTAVLWLLRRLLSGPRTP